MRIVLNRSRFTPLYVGLTCSIVLMTPVRAQEEPAPGEPTLLEELKIEAPAEQALDPIRGFVASQQITGTKTDTPLIESPQAITVVPRDQIDARQAQTLGEALRYASGVRGENYGSDSRTDWFQLRGFNAQDNGLFLNGLRYNVGYAGTVFETYGLERYEVMRGPTSVLYGQIAPGGLVNMFQRRPSDFSQGEVKTSVGNRNRYQVQGYASGPVDEDGVWSYGITALGRDSGTIVDHVDDDRFFVAPSFMWKPNDKTSVTLLTYYQNDKTSGNQFLPYSATVEAVPDGRINRSLFTGEPDFNKFDREQAGIGTEVAHRINDTWSVQQNMRYASASIDWDQVYGGGLEADQVTLSRFAYQADIDVDTFQIDNQIKADFITGPLDHTLLGGFDYSLVRYKNTQRFAVAEGLDVFSPSYGASIPDLGAPFSDIKQLNNQYGLYLQDQVRIGRWALVGGMRQDWANGDIDDRNAGTKNDQDDSAFTWRVGATYLSDLGLAPYASYATSFQPQLGTDGGGNAWEPLEGEQYEIGIKYQPPGMRSFIRLSAFELTQQNTLTADPDFIFQQVSTGEIRVRGLELEGIAEFGRGWSMYGSVTLMDPEITKSNVDGEEGHRPAGVPRADYNLYSEYTFVDAPNLLSGLTLGAGFRYLGNTSAVNTGGSVVPHALLFDAGARYDLGKISKKLDGFEFAVTGSNITNERYVSRCSGVNACFYGNGTSVLASLSYTW